MSTNSSPPELKWNRFDALVALAVVLLSVVSALCFYLPQNQSGALTVVIDISGQEVRRLPRRAVHRVPACPGGRPPGGRVRTGHA